MQYDFYQLVISSPIKNVTWVKPTPGFEPDLPAWEADNKPTELLVQKNVNICVIIDWDLLPYMLMYTNGSTWSWYIRPENWSIITLYLKIWNHKCDNESDAVRLSVQVRELCGWRDKCNCTFLDKIECKTIIDLLCTDWILTVCFCFKVPYFMCE